MRYDTPIYFRTFGKDVYNASTGNYDQAAPVDVKCMAAVMDTSRDTMRLVYGEIRQGSMTVQLQNHYDDTFDRIVIGDKIYTVDYSRRLRTKHTLIVSEVQ